jgi:hypothetical protein
VHDGVKRVMRGMQLSIRTCLTHVTSEMQM